MTARAVIGTVLLVIGATAQNPIGKYVERTFVHLTMYVLCLCVHLLRTVCCTAGGLFFADTLLSCTYMLVYHSHQWAVFLAVKQSMEIRELE